MASRRLVASLLRSSAARRPRSPFPSASKPSPRPSAVGHFLHRFAAHYATSAEATASTPSKSPSGVVNTGSPITTTVTQQRSNFVASGRADKWQSREELANDNEIEVRWKRPEEGFIKVNVSVVCCLAPVKLLAMAGIYRDSLASRQFGFKKTYYNPTGSPMADYFAEYLAILNSVELAASEGYLNVVIESVNKEVVEMITKYMKAVKEAPNEPGPDFSDMKFRKDERESLELIASLVPQGGTYRFAHIYKEANRVAGLMAMNQLMKEVDEERIV
ncbi:hypothetical protein CASFOL_039734 [Castilleja foliolosa]|uniref:ATP synthase F1 beta subunit domain-containing protein n=1 Tax=Castilleja foliolosa TaxID=1961234 RepID=A0ABD3BGG0_9LAMI